MFEMDATQSWVNRDYTRGLITHPCGAPVWRISEVEGLFTTFTTRGRPIRKSRTQLHGAGFRPRAPSLLMSLEGTVVLKAVVNEQHSYIGIPLIQMG
jgi:hypothetical protein